MFTNVVSVRIRVLTNILRKPHNVCRNNMRAYVSSGSVSIGAISKDLQKAQQPEYVPRNYYDNNQTQTTIHHLQWMMQKDILGQDIFLLGPPGPSKRYLAMQYLELTNRELEYISLSRDTTESDLKQRREIISGTATYFDQGAVRAAIEGRILILEGIEKAERNVLPVLNNLLENREMHLEDGRLLIPASRYDQLRQKHGLEELDKWKLVRVNENFRVIALGLPVPRYRGNPLDPPFRSRFQARDVNLFSYHEYYNELLRKSPNAPPKKLEAILSAAYALSSKESFKLGLPDFPIDNLFPIGKLLEQNPNLSSYDILCRLYPYKIFLKDDMNNLESLLTTFNIKPEKIGFFESVENKVQKFLTHTSPSEGVYVETPHQNYVIQSMLQTVSVSDFCVIGERGCGKSLLVNRVAESLGTQTENIVLYQDMTSRDLIQQRTTLDNGDTVWKFSPLVTAALQGRIAILDGIHRIHPSTLSVLYRLVHDRELQLHDGKRLISNERYKFMIENLKLTEEELQRSGVFAIHPDFRIIAIGEPPSGHASGGNWMTSEILSLFLFHELRSLSKEEEMHIITSQFGSIPKPLLQIIDLAHILRNSSDLTLKNLSGHLSTRQILRIATKMKNFQVDAYDLIQETFMIQFLPSLASKSLYKIIQNVGIRPRGLSGENDAVKCEIKDNILTIGQTSAPIYQTDHLTKVPNILFYDIPQHVRLMEKLLQDFQLNLHLLLVGNQGVGKNKIVDRFLELLNRPREYIQLHRDTTVQTLTTQPTVKHGRLIHEDSPLVKAVKYGHILVVDEADKAPTHVTCILKTLVESGQMVLSDGRHIVKDVPKNLNSDSIKIHPDFRIIVLANRPGFPFLGNDFFGALGDLFSSHAVGNPSRDSEISMLKQYGPNVPIYLISKIVDIFDELRTMADQGLVNYPYSTREVVNIVKHIEKFPDSDLEDAILNVFNFDRYSPDVVQTVGEVLSKHGLSGSNIFTQEYIAVKRAKENLQVTVDRYSGKDVNAPKHGKEDEKNEPHVGGNTWAGGTGGRDTAGLGGKGGPYRWDKGHKVHQLSDGEKNAVPQHITKAAREMGRKAFENELKRIGLSGYDASLYSQFSNSVSREVQSLRVILGNLQAKNKERYWTRHQTSGELDDIKLIDGLLGEKTIFRRRTNEEPELGAPQMKPKLFRVLVDVSGSMYRFNGHDGRLDRELEAAVLVMEAFEGYEDKIKYDIIGHSGDSPVIKFVDKHVPPKNNKERLQVIRNMHAHSQFCWTGDNTLEATELAVNSLAEEDCDESILVILSDANLQRYGIPPSKLGEAMSNKPQVSSYAIFIGSLGDQAERLTEKLPAGRSFICTDVKELPHILKQIFSSSIINF